MQQLLEAGVLAAQRRSVVVQQGGGGGGGVRLGLSGSDGTAVTWLGRHLLLLAVQVASKGVHSQHHAALQRARVAAREGAQVLRWGRFPHAGGHVGGEALLLLLVVVLVVVVVPRLLRGFDLDDGGVALRGLLLGCDGRVEGRHLTGSTPALLHHVTGTRGSGGGGGRGGG